MKKSLSLFEEGQQRFPGGVQSPVRAFRAVGTHPRYIARAQGARMWDVEGNAYIDYVCSWGAILLGHAHEGVQDAIRTALEKGNSFGACHEGEILLAREIQSRLPFLEQIRFVNSGTEATMSALRLARGFTGKKKIIKFDGAYHGHSDALLVKGGSGLATFSIPDSAGVQEQIVRDTEIAQFNSLESVQEIVERVRGDIAAIILEPICGNVGCILPEEGFLRDLEALCRRESIVLIFDEVMTGFRVAEGGAAQLYQVTPDLACYAKVIGGGLPVAAFGGRREIMQMLAPLGPVYQAGTMSGNPLGMAAGCAVLRACDEDLFQRLSRTTEALVSGMQEIFSDFSIPVYFQQKGAMFSCFFVEAPVRNAHDALTTKRDFFALLFQEMLARGVYLPPSALEACFVSAAHGEPECAHTLQALHESLVALRNR